MSSLFKKRYGSIANPCESIFIKIPQSTILLLNGSPHLQIPHGGFSRQVAPRRWWHSSREIHRNRRRKKIGKIQRWSSVVKGGWWKRTCWWWKKISCACNFRICPDIQKSWHNFSFVGTQTHLSNFLWRHPQKQTKTTMLKLLDSAFKTLEFPGDWCFLDYFDRVCTGGISTITAAGPQTDGIFKWTWILSDWFNIRGTNI